MTLIAITGSGGSMLAGSAADAFRAVVIMASSDCRNGAAIPIAVVEVATPPFALRELSNSEDVAPIGQALAEAGRE